MCNEISIEIFDSDEGFGDKAAKQAEIPQDYIKVGTGMDDAVCIFVTKDAHGTIETYSKEDTGHERGGILVGDYFEKNGRLYIFVTDFIEARYTDSTAFTLTFTHKTWEYVYDEMEKFHGDKCIVGWQHTHPGYGIFLSSYDIFIHKNFFNLPFQLAYVVDPINDARGFFYWKGKEIVKTYDYYLF